VIPLTLRPDAERFPGLISVTVPSRRRCELLAASVTSLRTTAARPELLELLVAYDPDDPETGRAAAGLGAALAWEAPRRYGYAGSAHYWAALLEQARGWWCLPTWSDDAVMITDGWDDLLRGCPPGTIAYTDGYPGLTCFPAVHMDALAALGRLCPLPAIDTWFEDIGRAAGILVQPGISVRQDRPDINGRNDDATHREGGGAWRAGGCGGMAYYTEPYSTWRTQDAARLRELRERG
jgi:hypothetical protein